MMSIYKKLIFFTSVFFLLCSIISLFIGLMTISYKGFMVLYDSYGNFILFLPPLGFLFTTYLIKKFAPQSSGSGYLDTVDVIENKTSELSTLDNVSIKDISYRDFLGRFFLTPLSVFVGGSLGVTGPLIHLCSAFVLMFEKKIVLKRNILVFCAVNSMMIIFLNSLFGGILFCLESIYLLNKKQSNQSNHQIKDSVNHQIIETLPFLILSSLITIFWLKIIGSWSYSLPSFSFSEHQLSQINWAGFVELIFICGIMTFIFKKVYVLSLKTMISHWKIQSLICGAVVSVLIYNFGPHLAGSGFIFMTENGMENYEFWQKWLANLATLCSGVSAGMVVPAMAIGSLLSHSLYLPLSFGMSAFLAAIINHPLTAAFIVAEFLDLNLLETLMGAIAGFYCLVFINYLITKVKIFRVS